MCGINGFNWKDESLIKRMNGVIKHRGPDDEGVFMDERLSLGHVRLSILDLSPRGKQPMSNADQTIRITYNGEIYNFQEIREDLKKRGCVFKTDTDTEVILAAYQQEGPSAFVKFNGIFAFCLYDTRDQCLCLVRDRLGIKPLYYYFDGQKFIFSSEIKALQATARVSISLDETAVAEYLFSQNIYTEGFLKGIETLRPGTYLRFDLLKKKMTQHPYSLLEEEIHQERYLNNKRKSEDELVDELDQLLHRVVKDQLISDAPLGTICSGGLDSSLITAIASEYKKDLKIFNVRVADHACDESMYARKVAEFLHLDLIEEVLDQPTYLKTYQKCMAFEDLPLMHPNSVGIFLVSRKAREAGLSVLLSGEGADELFGGYHHYKAFKKRLLLRRLPLVPRLLEKRHPLFLNEELMGVDSPDEKILSQKPWLKKRLTITQNFYQKYCFVEKDDDRQLKSFIAKDLQYYLPAILRRTDRMSMAVGLEMRVPYLDNRLIAFALNLPVQYQVSSSQVKILLKKVAQRYLPDDIVYRAKKGFPLPIEQWLGVQNFKNKFLEDWKKGF